jgi:UDP-N-acetylglucosamine--N-acetylmuramyl-(pentapeptide) pyrophosphoryl-undecaprenol N-acetylglucosamine transferase
VSAVHVVLAGGGTAGHVEPALNLADCLRRHDPDVGVTALGTERGLETRLVPERGYDLRLITPTPMPRRPSMDLVRLPSRLRTSVAEVREVLEDSRADVVVGFGGYVALPAYLAARGRVPIVIHEANARPGLANRVGARFTDHIGCAVPDAIAGSRHIGMPLRRTIAGLDRAASRAEARVAFGLDADRPTLLVFGGSQGARHLNQAVIDAAAGLTSLGIQVLHAVGGRNEDQRPSGGLGPAPYVVVPYIDRMDLAYAAADVALCRAGAMTCAELAAVGLPALYVPLPIGNGEQRFNALPVVNAGGGLVVEDALLDAERVQHILAPLLLDDDQRREMETAAASHGQRDADERLRQLVLDALGARTPSDTDDAGGPR